MKYLEDDKLTQLTSELTDAFLGGTNCRVVNGRIEAFTMKRAGTDKKYAHALGERYASEMEDVESQLETYQQFLLRHPKLSESPPRGGRKRSVSIGAQLEANKPPQKRRGRAISFDATGASSSSSSTKPPMAPSMRRATSVPAHLAPSPLGDFHEMGTRRLMTDLILTLNASFPDYDFGNIRPSHFVKVAVSSAVHRINERLSELASQKESFLGTLWSAIDNVITLEECHVYSFVPPARDQDDDALSFLAQTLVGEGASTTTPLWSFNYFFVNKHLKRILFFTCVETMGNQEEAGEESDVVVTKSLGYNTDASDIDFDLDPAADVAGGIPVATV